MKTRWKKALLSFSATLLLAGMLCACSNGKNPDSTQTTPATEQIGEEPDNLYDKNGYLKDSLPETYDFNSDFVIYTWDEQKNWEWVDDTSKVEGTVMQKLVERQHAVQERFGVTLKLVYEHGDWTNRTTFIQKLSNNVQNNTHAYDLVGQYTPAAGIGATQGLYENLAYSEYLDLSKPWWPSAISSTAKVGDKLYFVTGDITPLLIRNVQCMFVNTDRYAALNLSGLTEGKSIYDVVRDREWTLETLKTLGIGTVGNGEGEFGISFLNDVAADSFFYGAGFMYLENENGVLTLSNDLKRSTLYNFFDEVKKLFIGTYPDVSVAGSAPFIANKAVFYAGNVSDSQRFTQEGIHFSILPMPMLNESQQDYHTCASFWVSMYSIPTDAKNKQMSETILEALGSQAYRSVSDEIYYNLFQSRYNADGGNDSSQMFDILSDSVVFDTARMFADELGLFAKFRAGVNDNTDPNGTWSGIYEGEHSTWETKIQKLYGKVG